MFKVISKEEIITKLKRFANKKDKWIFMDHPYQIQAEEVILILKMLDIEYVKKEI